MSSILHAHYDAVQGRGQPLFDGTDSHALHVSHLAARFAETMIAARHSGLKELARSAAHLLGLWHDMGKASEPFQHHLHAAGDPHTLETDGKIDHASAGAQHAASAIPYLGVLLAYVIAGHHSGLPDWHGLGDSVLKKRLRKSIPQWQKRIPDGLLSGPNLTSLAAHLPADPFAIAFLVRMLFSCLNDADFLSTEAFLEPDHAQHRIPPLPALEQLAIHLDKKLSERFGPHSANHTAPCPQAARQSAGFFACTTPPSNRANSLLALRFALRHGHLHGMQRVIHVLPHSAMIEQHAQFYQDCFAEMGEHVVLEHHAHLDPEDPAALQQRLAVENWHATLLVTSAEPFLTTLFASRPGRCRKLHRLARTVIILELAQTIPPALLNPVLTALKTLVQHYGCTVVLADCSHIALRHRRDFPIGLKEVREIRPDTPPEPQQTPRVRQYGTLSCSILVQQLLAENQVLTIINHQHHAHTLFMQLQSAAPGEQAPFLLCSTMTAQHRLAVIWQIRQRLLDPSQSCRVIASATLGMGLELAFPVVYRTLDGLDALAQAAGWCQRTEQAPFGGELRIFQPQEAEWAATGLHKEAAELAWQFLQALDDAEDPFSDSAMEHYFRLRYWQKGGKKGLGWDSNEIVSCFQMGTTNELFQFHFRTADNRFQLNDTPQVPLVIPWTEEAQQVVQTLRHHPHPKNTLLRHSARRLQRHLVQVSAHSFQQLVAEQAVETLHGRFHILKNMDIFYCRHAGLQVAEKESTSP